MLITYNTQPIVFHSLFLFKYLISGFWIQKMIWEKCNAEVKVLSILLKGKYAIVWNGSHVE